MAHITLSGILLDPTGEFAVGDKIRFTHKSTTGSTVKSAVSWLTVPPDGSYSIDLEYGLVLVEYNDYKRGSYANLGVTTVNQDNLATTIPELLNAVVPASDAVILEMQAILADTLSQATIATEQATIATEQATLISNSALEIKTPTKADFFAQAEKRIRDNAGSGFAEWGKDRVEPNYWKTVSNGMGTSTDGIYANSNLYLAKLNSTQTGVSRTGHPLVNVNGSSLNISHVNDAANYGAVIKFPPAPDGTKTYDSATGSVVEHASAAEAFEGLITNGDFRNGTTGWYTGGGALASIVDGAYKFTNNGTYGSASATSFTTGVSGTTYRLEFNLVGISGGNELNTANLPDGTYFSTSGVGRYVVEFTANGTNSLSFSIGGNTTGHYKIIDNVSVMPVTESVITSRQDFTFLESFHEKISDKDVVYPLGNVQYGASSWEGVTLSNTVEAQGYSAFGEWDTSTKGYGVVWSTLSDANKAKFLQDPENNIYNDDGDLVQVRYRVRVVEGLGDDWQYTNSWDDTNGNVTLAQLAYTTNTNRVRPMGKRTTSLGDLGAGNTQFTNEIYSPDIKGKQGLSQATSFLHVADLSSAHNGLCFAVPIALVQRRNSGAYHPAFNSEGCKYFGKTGNILSQSSWYTAGTGTVPLATSEASCFSTITEGGVKSENTTTGGIGGASGRSDSKFYDAIYASDVQDLRMSSKRLPLTEIREKYKRMGIAGDVRGYEAVPFSPVGTVEDSALGNIGLTIDMAQFGDISQITSAPHYAGDLRYECYNINTGITFTSSAYRLGQEQYVYLDTSAAYGSCAVGHRVLVLARKVNGVVKRTHKQASPTWTDIIGDPVNIAATFPQGVEGQWIPVVPDGTTTAWELNRKSLVTTIDRERTSDNGITWVADVRSVSGTTNASTYVIGVGQINILHYSTQSHFTADDVNSKVLDLGGVYGSSAYLTTYGNMLVSSLINKVATCDGGPARFDANTPITLHTFESDRTLSKSSEYEVTHSDMGIGYENNTPAGKTLDYLSSENGVAKLMYAYKEMVYDSGADAWTDDGSLTVANGGAMVAGKLYKLVQTTSNLNGRIIQCLVNSNVSDWSGVSEMGGKIVTTDGITVTNYILWNGNGWGDNNQFEITNNQATQTDDNGNTIKYGTASFNTQYFITEE